MYSLPSWYTIPKLVVWSYLLHIGAWKLQNLLRRERIPQFSSSLSDWKIRELLDVFLFDSTWHWLPELQSKCLKQKRLNDFTQRCIWSNFKKTFLMEVKLKVSAFLSFKALLLAILGLVLYSINFVVICSNLSKTSLLYNPFPFHKEWKNEISLDLLLVKIILLTK